jgi:hypothetical protein
LVDIDQDGHLDIVSGSYSRSGGGIPGMAGTFQVLYGQSGGKFKKAETLNGSDGQPLVIPGKGEDDLTKRICTRQFVADWNGDGKLDLVTGNFEGTFFWFKGDGKGKFDPKPEPINEGDKPLKVPGHHSDPFVVDWDGDGDLDLLSSSTDAGVYFAENSAGTGKAPTLKGFRALINPAGKEWETGKTAREADLKRPTYGCRIWVDDVNGDGKLDVFVGDRVSVSSPKEGVSDAELKEKLAEWEKDNKAAMDKYMEARSKIKDSKKITTEEREMLSKASEPLSKLRQRRASFITEESTGFVWLYLQK